MTIELTPYPANDRATVLLLGPVTGDLSEGRLCWDLDRATAARLCGALAAWLIGDTETVEEA